jgi:hypothetical protein
MVSRQDDISPLGCARKHEGRELFGRGMQRLSRLLGECFARAAGHPEQGGHARNVDFVNRADRFDQVAQVVGDFLGITAEFNGRVHVLPSTLADEPARRSEMVIGDNRFQAICQTGFAHAAIVIEGGGGETAVFRLHPRPLHRKAIAVKPQPGQQGDVFRVAMIMVNGITGRLGKNCIRQVFHHPKIAVCIIPFYLMGGRGRAPQKPLRKFIIHTIYYLTHAPAPAACRRCRRRAG